MLAAHRLGTSAMGFVKDELPWPAAAGPAASSALMLGQPAWQVLRMSDIQPSRGVAEHGDKEHDQDWLPGSALPWKETRNLAVNPSPEGPALPLSYPGARIARCWLPSQDSNLDQRIQSPVCYRYTTRHWALYMFALVPKAGVEPARGL